MLHIIAVVGITALCIAGGIVLLGVCLAALILNSKENPFE